MHQSNECWVNRKVFCRLFDVLNPRLAYKKQNKKYQFITGSSLKYLRAVRSMMQSKRPMHIHADKNSSHHPAEEKQKSIYILLLNIYHCDRNDDRSFLKGL